VGDEGFDRFDSSDRGKILGEQGVHGIAAEAYVKFTGDCLDRKGYAGVAVPGKKGRQHDGKRGENDADCRELSPVKRKGKLTPSFGGSQMTADCGLRVRLIPEPGVQSKRGTRCNFRQALRAESPSHGLGQSSAASSRSVIILPVAASADSSSHRTLSSRDQPRNVRDKTGKVQPR
jgi:hypothetical protein